MSRAIPHRVDPEIVWRAQRKLDRLPTTQQPDRPGPSMLGAELARMAAENA
jgi:hypothetical protein